MNEIIKIITYFAMAVVGIWFFVWGIGQIDQYFSRTYREKRAVCIEQTQNPLYCYERYR